MTKAGQSSPSHGRRRPSRSRSSFPEQGHFTWKEWAAALADELQAAARRGEPDDGSRYYEHWLTALERLVTAKGLTIRRATRRARKPGPKPTETTPHGTPVELARSESLMRAGFFLGSLPRSLATG